MRLVLGFANRRKNCLTPNIRSDTEHSANSSSPLGGQYGGREKAGRSRGRGRYLNLNRKGGRERNMGGVSAGRLPYKGYGLQKEEKEGCSLVGR